MRSPDTVREEGEFGAFAHRAGVRRVVEAMRAGEALSLGDMADIAHLSPYHFARTFKRMTGASPGEFGSAVRLQRAKELLLTTDLSGEKAGGRPIRGWSRSPDKRCS